MERFEKMPDIFKDISKIRVDSMAAAPGVKEILAQIPIRKPPNQDFFRANPDSQYQLRCLCFIDKEEREIYIITPEMQSTLIDQAKLVLIVLCVTRSGLYFFWPITLPDTSGRRNSWAESALEVRRHAETAWIRAVADMSLGGYRIYQAEGQLTDPVWPDKPFNELLEIAFANRVIDTPDHAVVRRLRGLA